MAYKCGKNPGIGRYICLNCGEDLHLDDSSVDCHLAEDVGIVLL